MTFRRSCLAISSIYVALVTLQYNSNLNRDDVIPSSIIAVDNQIPQQLLDYYTKQRLLTDYSELQRCILALSRDFTIRLNAKQEPSPAVPIDVLDAIHVFVRGLEPIQYGMIKSLVYRDDDENKN